ncbi:MAG: sugar phosphate isomerase/epimerase [Verrucomicrobia bacterium]|nr:sugar phosphate isomerase/epimerase [Verrucomicrobiota bacterium]
MKTQSATWTRREFAQTLALAGAGLTLGSPALAQAPATRRTKLGFDNFSLRAMGWRAPALIDYAAEQKLDSLFITNLDALESFEDAYLREVRARAVDQGIDLLLGSWSICPTAKAFRSTWGTAEEHLALGLRLAKALGSPMFRCILGSRDDRRSPGGIEQRIEDTVKVCRAVRNRALDAGVKIAIENHAGDLQAWELIQLVEAAGKDYVGVTYDSGNVTWTLEDPVDSLEKLAPYVLCTHIRDSMVWETEDGARVAWTAIGEGCTDAKALFARLAELCPGVGVHAEIISGFAVDFSYFKPGFWEAWPKARAVDFAKFLALARQGKAIPPFRPADGQDRRQAEQAYQKAELERSLAYCKEVIGLGAKG